MFTELQISSNVCPECKGLVIPICIRGELVCEQCGLVIKERDIDISHSGIRAFTNQEREKKWQNGSPISILVPDIGLSTIIERNKIYNENLKRAVKWDFHMSWKNKNLLIAITELKRIASNLNLPDYIQKRVIKLYKEAFKKDLLRGRSIRGMLAASIHLACKEEDIPITLGELLKESAVDPKVIKKCFKVLVRELKLSPRVLNPILLIPKFINQLNLDIEAENQTIELMKKYMEKKHIWGKDPKGLCAGAMYLVSKLREKKVTQRKISEVTGVTEVTLRSRYKELLNLLKINIELIS